MHKGFYYKLAFTNLGKNRKFYLPYMLSCILMVMLGMSDESPGRSGPLLLAAGDLVGELLQKLRQAQLGRQGLEALLHLPIGHPGQDQYACAVLPGGRGPHPLRGL